MSDSEARETSRRVVLAIYDSEEKAQSALDEIVAGDFPLDRVSVLGPASSSGDDPLGVYYPSAGERMKGWGGMGAFWGGLWGLLSGAAGLFLVPGVGPVVAAGPVVEALTGAAAGAGLGGGVLAGGAALSQLTVAVHRMGVPEERLEEVQGMVDRGRYLLLLIVAADEVASWRGRLSATRPDPLWDFPYTGLRDAASEALSR